MFWKVIALLSPFISAVIAGRIAYAAGKKRAKADAFLSRRLLALEKIHVALVKFRSYVECRVSELEGNEYAPNPDKEENINSYVFPLWEVQSYENLFLTSIERKKLSRLDGDAAMARSMERSLISNPDLEQKSKESALDLYGRISRAATEAIEELYSELRKEYEA